MRWLSGTIGQKKAHQILERAEALAKPTGLFAEAIDPRTRTSLGNTPLLFSQTEYVRAVQACECAGSKS
jgi:GH15 family glucan-1,4-alpha-glucosidase